MIPRSFNPLVCVFVFRTRNILNPFLSLVERMPAPAKSAKSSPFSKRLKNPQSSVKISSFGRALFSVTMDASLSKNKIADIGFETTGPAEFVSILAQGCSYFIGLSHDEAEVLALDLFSKKFSVSPQERVYVEYAWSAIQDVISRLPFEDPMSKAITKISRLHDEFPLIVSKEDEED